VHRASTWTQGLADWISGHVGAFEAIGGVPALLVPDNTKVAVIKACLYDPQINRSYADMAAHYDTAILPARPRRHGAAQMSANPSGVPHQRLSRLRPNKPRSSAGKL
jgi:transposase